MAADAPAPDMSKCPVDHKNMTPEQIADYMKKNPMLAARFGKHSSTTTATTPVTPATEPVVVAPVVAPVESAKASSTTPSTTTSGSSNGKPFVSRADLEKFPVNHDNQMPQLPQTRAEGQRIDLPLERTDSTIPRVDGADSKVWEYPSPQQFYNALKRKGWETPEEEIETMVEIHNFLNEASWLEVLRLESQYHCDCNDIRLANFRGRPQDISPKAWFRSWFGGDRPFDRHDWTVDRCGQKVRYVIDYYSLPDEEPGVPAFNVDVRPALDSFGAAFDRLRMFSENMYNKFLGVNDQREIRSDAPPEK